MYADDSTIHTSAQSIEELNVELTNDITNVQTWCTDNNMVVTHDKSRAMLITTYQRATRFDSDLQVDFDGVRLKNTVS